jgi:multidrug transporter EmrE-like cation transporter
MDKPVFNLKTIAALTLLSTVGDFSLKASVRKGFDAGLPIGFTAYFTMPFVLSENFKTNGVAYTNNMWNAGTSLLETFIGYIEGEPLSNPNLVGIALIIAGMILLNK